jgi:hypothetical protein
MLCDRKLHRVFGGGGGGGVVVGINTSGLSAEYVSHTCVPIGHYYLRNAYVVVVLQYNNLMYVILVC